ncbi:MAG: hypothetical protein QNK31_06565 [Porticoccus sp.]|nr:hypothetical protein [Porticoccus sp.]
MSITLYTHLPGVRLEENNIPFANGHLTKLPFDEWFALESKFKYTETKYKKSAPVFWIKVLATDDKTGLNELIDTTSEETEQLHTAFLLEPRTPLLPTPSLSSSYITIPSSPDISDVVKGSTQRLIGPMEREYIVFGSPLQYLYSAPELKLVEDIYNLIRATNVLHLTEELTAGISVLEETARPDSWYEGDQQISLLSGFVQCIAACENILLPPKEQIPPGKKTETFGQQAASLTNITPSENEKSAKKYSDLYRLRSSLMHGLPASSQHSNKMDSSLHEGRVLLRYSILASLELRNSVPDAPPLWSLLKEKWSSLNIASPTTTLDIEEVL